MFCLGLGFRCLLLFKLVWLGGFSAILIFAYFSGFLLLSYLGYFCCTLKGLVICCILRVFTVICRVFDVCGIFWYILIILLLIDVSSLSGFWVILWDLDIFYYILGNLLCFDVL